LIIHEIGAVFFLQQLIHLVQISQKLYCKNNIATNVGEST